MSWDCPYLYGTITFPMPDSKHSKNRIIEPPFLSQQFLHSSLNHDGGRCGWVAFYEGGETGPRNSGTGLYGEKAGPPSNTKSQQKSESDLRCYPREGC